MAKLAEYKNAKALVQEVEDKLDYMVRKFFTGEKHVWEFESLSYSVTDEISELTVTSYYCESDDYVTYKVPTKIIDKYFEGNEDEAVKEFKQFLTEDKKRREEERLREIETRKRLAEAAALRKKQEAEEAERALYEKLKKKYGDV